MKKKSDKKDHITIVEAVENLSDMANLENEDLEDGQDKDLPVATLTHRKWLNRKDNKKTIENIRGTFRVVKKYMEHVHSKDKSLKDKDIQVGLRSIVTLSKEAAHKLDSLKILDTSVKRTREYTDFMRFYQDKLAKKLEKNLQKEEEWKAREDQVYAAEEIEKIGLKDLEAVTRDQDYELFYILQEDGSQFYSKNLIRHIRLVTDFDQLIHKFTQEDPLIKIQLIIDKRAQILANTIKSQLTQDIQAWIPQAGKFRDDPFIKNVFFCMQSLFLASYEKNRVMNTRGKSAIQYFKDLQFFLREAFSSIEYEQIMNMEAKEIEPFHEKIVDFLHLCSYFLFTSPIDQDDANALLQKIFQSDQNKDKKNTSSLYFWNSLFDNYNSIETLLKEFPSGPLFKLLDILHDQDSVEFDPYMQGNLSEHIFTAYLQGKGVNVFTLACPTIQKEINKASVIPEFLGCIRQIVKDHKHALVINLQDRTSWKEFSRCFVMEKFQQQAEIRKHIDVVSLSKNTEFYWQMNTYKDINDTSEFIYIFLEQIKNEEACGFYFPKYISRDEIQEFSKKAIDLILECFFNNKKHLTHKNRVDFIEIFYQFFTLFFLQKTKATHLFFMGKDNVDSAPTTTFGFYSLLKFFSQDMSWKEEEKDFLAGVLFIPALLFRERPVLLPPLSRTVSMLAVISAEMETFKAKDFKKFEALYGENFSKSISLFRDKI